MHIADRVFDIAFKQIENEHTCSNCQNKVNYNYSDIYYKKVISCPFCGKEYYFNDTNFNNNLSYLETRKNWFIEAISDIQEKQNINLDHLSDSQLEKMFKEIIDDIKQILKKEN